MGCKVFAKSSAVVQWVKHLPAMQKIQVMQVQSLGWGDPWRGHANSLQYFAWRIQWTVDPGRLQPIGLQELDMTEANEHAHAIFIFYDWKNHIFKFPLLMTLNDSELIQLKYIVYSFNFPK